MGRSRDLADGTLAELNVDSNTLAVDATNNRVGIGTSSPNVLGHFYKGASGRAWSVDGADVLAVEHSDTAVIDIRTPNANSGNIYFSDADARGRGSIGYAHSADAMIFRTASAERMRILSSGGITFNGDTAAANALDDYEEGTWTPIIASSAGSITSYTSAGRYRKIGSLVILDYHYQITNNGTGSGGIGISGLPFTNTGGVNTGGAGVLKEIALTGKAAASYFNSTTAMFLVNADNTYPGGTNAYYCGNAIYIA